MVHAYEFSGDRNEAVEKVERQFPGVDTLTLVAMWSAIDAWERYSRPVSHAGACMK